MNERPAQPRGDDELLDHVVQQYIDDLRGGRNPDIGQFQQRHPHLADEIHELLSSAAMIESLKREPQSGSGSARANHQPLDLQRLGDYRIIEELGRGGMGVVLLGVHESLGRRVAIKVMPAHLASNDIYVERFRREAQAAATLHHTNIVGVFGVGRSDGHHYYVMEYVDGRGLNRVIQAMSQQEPSPGSTRTPPVSTRRANAPPPTAGQPTLHDEARTSVNHPRDQGFSLGDQAPVERDAFPELPRGPKRFRWAAELWRKSQTPWNMPTSRASCIGTSSPPTCCWIEKARSG